MIRLSHTQGFDYFWRLILSNGIEGFYESGELKYQSHFELLVIEFDYRCLNLATFLIFYAKRTYDIGMKRSLKMAYDICLETHRKSLKNGPVNHIKIFDKATPERE